MLIDSHKLVWPPDLKPFAPSTQPPFSVRPSCPKSKLPAPTVSETRFPPPGPEANCSRSFIDRESRHDVLPPSLFSALWWPVALLLNGSKMDFEGLAAFGAGCDDFAVGMVDIWPAFWMLLYQWLHVHANKNAIDVDQTTTSTNHGRSRSTRAVTGHQFNLHSPLRIQLHNCTLHEVHVGPAFAHVGTPNAIFSVEMVNIYSMTRRGADQRPSNFPRPIVP